MLCNMIETKQVFRAFREHAVDCGHAETRILNSAAEFFYAARDESRYNKHHDVVGGMCASVPVCVYYRKSLYSD